MIRTRLRLTPLRESGRMRVCFVLGLSLAVLGSSSVAAHAQSLCDPGYFCDRDGDSHVKSHTRCSCDPLPIDCDDSDPTNACELDPELFPFWATLTGAIGFAGPGPELFTKIRGSQANNQDSPITLSRESAAPGVWDAVFAACTELFPIGTSPDSVVVSIENALIQKSAADIRIYFSDFVVDDGGGRASTMQLGLIGRTAQGPGELGNPIIYDLVTFSIYGSSLQGGPGGKKRCGATDQRLPFGTSSQLEVLEDWP